LKFTETKTVKPAGTLKKTKPPDGLEASLNKTRGNKSMNTEQKKQIQEAINGWIEPGNEKRSGNKLANKISISNATIANMKNGKWEQISDTLWNKAAAYFGIKVESDGWGHFDFPEYDIISDVIKHAQRHQERVAIDGPSGKSKSYSIKQVVAADRSGEMFHVISRKSMNPKTFCAEIAKKVSNSIEHTNRYDMEDQISQKFLGMDRPVLILDELENLSEKCWSSIKSIIDLTDGHLAVVLVGIDVYDIINKNALKGKDSFKQLRRRFPVHSYEFLPEGIDPAVMQETLVKSGIKDKNAIEWFIENVFDYDALSHVVRNALRISKKTNKDIDRMFMSKYFGKKSRIIYKPSLNKAA
jgi:hypothetical protein